MCQHQSIQRGSPELVTRGGHRRGSPEGVTRGGHRRESPEGVTGAQPVKIDLNKKLLPKQKTIEIFIIDAQAFRKTKNENPPTREIGVAS